MSAPGGKNSSTGKSGGKSLVTDSKKSLISFARILTFPEQRVLARHCRLSQLTLTLQVLSRYSTIVSDVRSRLILFFVGNTFVTRTFSHD